MPASCSSLCSIPQRGGADIPSTEFWQISQKKLITPLDVSTDIVADTFEPVVNWPFLLVPANRPLRQDFDVADEDYRYVPPACRTAGNDQRVHVALHGCKQHAREFAASAVDNNWADHYRVIVVYRALT